MGEGLESKSVSSLEVGVVKVCSLDAASLRPGGVLNLAVRRPDSRPTCSAIAGRLRTRTPSQIHVFLVEGYSRDTRVLSSFQAVHVSIADDHLVGV